MRIKNSKANFYSQYKSFRYIGDRTKTDWTDGS